MTNQEAKAHESHRVFHPTCSLCRTERSLGGAVPVVKYDSALLRKIK
jgi:hypothetical protein